MMIHSDQLDALIQPVVSLYADFADATIVDIARRLGKLDFATSTAGWMTQRLSESGMVYEDILKRLSALTHKSEIELRAMFQKAGVRALRFDDLVYIKAGLHPIPIHLSPAMANVLAAGLRKTQGIARNFTLTTAISGQQAFVNAADKAYLEVSSGAFSYDSAIRQAVKDMSVQGFNTVGYANRVDWADVAMRRTVLTGVSQTVGNLQMARMDEMNVDLVQTSAHAGSRPEHELWQGQVFSRSGTNPKYPDFVTETGYGEVDGLMGINCVVGDALVSSSTIRAAYRRKYTGEIIILRTASGKELSATPNHPILTDHGWVAAGLLTCGDNVISCSTFDGITRAGPNINEQISSIKDIFDSLCEGGDLVRFPASSGYFHGDVSNGEIDTVFPKSFLRNGNNTALFQQTEKVFFLNTSEPSDSLATDGVINKVFFGSNHSPNRVMGGFSKLLAFFRRHSIKSIAHSFGAIVCLWNSKSSKIFPNLHFVYSGVGGNLVFPHARLIHEEQVLRSYSVSAHHARFPVTLNVNIPLLKATLNGVNGAHVFVSDMLKGFTGRVQVDNVVFVDRQYFEGHVYNLHTEGEWYSANGIITHNCRHSFFPFFEDISQNAYTEAQVEDLNSQTVTYQGKEISQYEASQIQRKLERSVRDWKRQSSALTAAGLDDSVENAKVKSYQSFLRDFVKQTGLNRQYPREQV